MWTMKLTESTYICCTSDGLVCQYQRKIHRKQWFPPNVHVVNELQSENKRPIA